MKQLSMECMRRVCGGQVQVAAEIAGGKPLMEAGATMAGIGAGYGAAVAIETAGGLAAMGQAAIGASTAYGGGLFATGYAGWSVGTYAYNHSETVQDVSQAAVGWVVETFQSVSDYFQGIGEHSCTYGVGGVPNDIDGDVSII